jgi:hypothetical protein
MSFAAIMGALKAAGPVLGEIGAVTNMLGGTGAAGGENKTAAALAGAPIGQASVGAPVADVGVAAAPPPVAAAAPAPVLQVPQTPVPAPAPAPAPAAAPAPTADPNSLLNMLAQLGSTTNKLG